MILNGIIYTKLENSFNKKGSKFWITRASLQASTFGKDLKKLWRTNSKLFSPLKPTFCEKSRIKLNREKRTFKSGQIVKNSVDDEVIDQNIRRIVLKYGWTTYPTILSPLVLDSASKENTFKGPIIKESKKVK